MELYHSLFVTPEILLVGFFVEMCRFFVFFKGSCMLYLNLSLVDSGSKQKGNLIKQVSLLISASVGALDLKASNP